MLDGVRPRSEPLLLRRVIMNTIPAFGISLDIIFPYCIRVTEFLIPDVQGQGCCPYIQLFKNGKLIATASALTEGESNKKGEDATSAKQGKTQLRWISKAEGSASFGVDCPIQGDILLRCRHAATSGSFLHSYFFYSFCSTPFEGDFYKSFRSQGEHVQGGLPYRLCSQRGT